MAAEQTPKTMKELTQVEVYITVREDVDGEQGNLIEKYVMSTDPKAYELNVYKELNGASEEDFVDIAGVMIRRGSILYVDICYTGTEEGDE